MLFRNTLENLEHFSQNFSPMKTRIKNNLTSELKFTEKC